MKILKDIIYGIDLDSIKGDTNLIIKSVEFDSRKVVEGSLFIAIKGENIDGHMFIDKANLFLYNFYVRFLSFYDTHIEDIYNIETSFKQVPNININILGTLQHFTL